MNVKAVKCMPSSCINNLRKHCSLSPLNPYQCNVGLVGSSARRNNIRFMPSANVNLNCEPCKFLFFAIIIFLA